MTVRISAGRRTPVSPRGLVALLVILIFTFAVGASTGGEWSGWRGPEGEGRAVGVGPLHWSDRTNVAWKTAIPGKGYSSPIVTRDAVYVTTGYNGEPDAATLVGSRWAVVAGLALIGALCLPGILKLAVAAGNSEGQVSRGTGLASATGRLLLLVVLCAAALFAEVLLDFGSAVEKPWTAAALVGTMTLGLTGLAGGRAAGGAALIGFSLLLTVTIPDRAHTIVENPLSSVSLLLYAVILLPALVGGMLLTQRQQRRQRPQDPDGDATHRSWGVAVGLASAGLAGISFLLLVALGDGHAETDRTITEAHYEPALRGVGLWAAGLLLAASVAFGLRRGPSPGWNLAVVVTGAGLLFLLLLVLSEQLVARIPYLAYLIASPTGTPLLGWGSVVAVVLAASAAALRTFFPAYRRSAPVESRAPELIPAVGVLFTIFYFVYACYVPKSPFLERSVVCLDRNKGEIRWMSAGLRSARGLFHSDNSPATPTPVTDGESVFAYFGTPGLVCVGARDGRVRWMNAELPFQTREGVATSPVLWRNRVLILSESDRGNYLAALDAKTGKQMWRTERTEKVHSYAGNCRTPVVKLLDGRPTVVVWGQEDLTGYDPMTGLLLWTHALGSLGQGDNPVASMASDAHSFYVAGTQRAIALDRDELPAGDSKTVVRWKSELNDGIQCASPVAGNGLLVGVSDGGTAFGLDAATGRELWYRDLGAQHYASPLADEKRLYFCSTEGRTSVLSFDRKGTILARNDLGEALFASPALVDGDLFLRTEGHLYCIREDLSARRRGR